MGPCGASRIKISQLWRPRPSQRVNDPIKKKNQQKMPSEQGTKALFSWAPNLVSPSAKRRLEGGKLGKINLLKDERKGHIRRLALPKTRFSSARNGEPGSGRQTRSWPQSRERPRLAARSSTAQPVMRTSMRRRIRRARAASGRMASSCSCTSISTICSFVRMSGRSHWRESSRSCRNASRGPAASW